MIEFHFESEFSMDELSMYSDWIDRIIVSEGFDLGNLNFIFCDDGYLLEMNRKHLNHDTYTDIITFDYCNGSTISGDVFISADRVEENAYKYEVPLEEELRRVMAHGVLHLMGFGDKSPEEVLMMRNKEEEKMKLFHVEP